VCGWIRDHLSTELGWRYTWETNGLVYRRATPWPGGLTEVRPLAAFPEQQLSTKCANRAAEKTLTRVSVCFTLTQPFHTIDLSSKSWCGPRRSKTESGTTFLNMESLFEQYSQVVIERELSYIKSYDHLRTSTT